MSSVSVQNARLNARRWRIFDAQPRPIKEIGWDMNLLFTTVIAASDVAAALQAFAGKINRARQARADPNWPRRNIRVRIRPVCRDGHLEYDCLKRAR